MMNCQDTQQQFDNYLDHQLENGHDELQAEFHLHLAECSSCREALNREKHFRATLSQLPVEPMSPTFAAQALRNARNNGRPAVRPFVSGAIAASFLLFFSFVVLFQSAPSESITDSITVALLEERKVTLAFNSPQPIQQARFEIQLPAGVELKGYPGQQMLAWNGSLKRGQNILQLPIVVRSGRGGELKALIHHQNQNKSFSINIEVAAGNISNHLPITILETTTI